MRTVIITIEPEENVSEDAFSLECLATVNGKQYYEGLRAVYELLGNYHRENDLGAMTGKAVFEDIRAKTSKHLRGVVL